MSLNGAMYVGATGLQTYSNAMSVVSDNIANSNTTAYKSNSVRFGDMVGGFMPITTKDSDHMGAGVSILGNFTNFSQGSITSTSTWSDLAVNGEGFFRVSNMTDGGQATGETYYTRDGSFHIGSNGYLVNNSGLVVLNADGEPIKCLQYPGNPEYNNFYVDNDGQVYGSRIRTAEVTSTDSVLSKTSKVTHASTDTFTLPPGTGDTFNYDVTAASGETSATVTFTIKDADGNTVRSETKTITAGTGLTYTWDGLDNQGNAVPTGSNYTFSVASTDGTAVLAAAETGTTTNPVDATATSDYTTAYTLAEESYVSVRILDGNGNLKRTINIAGTQAAGAQTYTWDGTDDAGNMMDPGEYTTEIYTSPATGGVDSFSYDLLTDADVTVKVYDSDGKLVNTITQEGLSEGSYTFNWNGRDSSGNPTAAGNYTYAISTSKDNKSEAITDAVVHLTVIPNEDGLIRQGTNLYTIGAEAGTPLNSGTSWENTAGTVTDYSLESSNVDLATELVNMIIYQSTYNANSKSITTASNMIDTTVNLVR